VALRIAAMDLFVCLSVDKLRTQNAIFSDKERLQELRSFMMTYRKCYVSLSTGDLEWPLTELLFNNLRRLLQPLHRQPFLANLDLRRR